MEEEGLLLLKWRCQGGAEVEEGGLLVKWRYHGGADVEKEGLLLNMSQGGAEAYLGYKSGRDLSVTRPHPR